MPDSHGGLRRTVLIVAALNLASFGVEFAVAQAIGSVRTAGAAGAAQSSGFRRVSAVFSIQPVLPATRT